MANNIENATLGELTDLVPENFSWLLRSDRANRFFCHLYGPRNPGDESVFIVGSDAWLASGGISVKVYDVSPEQAFRVALLRLAEQLA